MRNVIEEYLVKIGADVDRNAFIGASQAVGTITSAVNQLSGLVKYGAPFVAIASGFAAIAKAVIDNTKAVAKADLEYQKLAMNMWTTKETAKSLSIAMKTMGATTEEIAWIPELREQFFRLREEMNALATPADADSQLRYIRDIGYDIQVLWVQLKQFREWVVYYLIKYLAGPIEELKKFISWLSTKIRGNISDYAHKLAKWLASIIQFGLNIIEIFTKIIVSVSDFLSGLPPTIKKVGMAIAAIGSLLLVHPFFQLIAAISAVLILIEDFYGYMNGWDTSETLAPMWKWILDLTKGGDGVLSGWMSSIEKFLRNVKKIFEDIFKGLDIKNILGEWKYAIEQIYKGVQNLITAVLALLAIFTGKKYQASDFWHSLGAAIKLALNTTARLISAIGVFAQAIALCVDGKWSEAGKVIGSFVLRAATGFKNDVADIFSGGGLDKAKSIVDSPTSDFLGNPNGCTYFVQEAIGRDDEFVESLKGDLYVPHWVTEADNQGRWHAGTEGLQAGDIVVFDYGKPGGYGDHVAIFDGKGGAYGNSTENERPEYYPDISVLGKIGGYIRPGGIKDIQPEENKQGTFGGGTTNGSGSSASWDLSPTSYAGSAHSSSFAPLGVYQGSSGNKSIVYSQNIEVNVAKTNATAEDIAKATADKALALDNLKALYATEGAFV